MPSKAVGRWTRRPRRPRRAGRGPSEARSDVGRGAAAAAAGGGAPSRPPPSLAPHAPASSVLLQTCLSFIFEAPRCRSRVPGRSCDDKTNQILYGNSALGHNSQCKELGLKPEPSESTRTEDDKLEDLVHILHPDDLESDKYWKDIPNGIEMCNEALEPLGHSCEVMKNMKHS